MSSLFLLHSDPLRPPETPLMGRGLVFAIIAHAALITALSAGVNWRTKAPPAFEAELWSAVPQAAAPKEVVPPAPEAEPEVVKKPEPKAVEEDAQAERDAEIAIAREQKKKRAAAELEAERKKRELALKEDQRKEDQRKEEQRKEDKLKQAKLDKDKKENQLKLDKQAEAKLDAQRQENLRRIQGMAGANGAPNATGTALKSSGPSATYGGRIKASIRPNIIFTDTPNGNPVAEVEVRVAPDGTIISRKLLKPSGDAEWDKAVLRAIDKTEKLPRDVDGRVPPVLVISFQPLE
ncbi:cell envelope integrity protein TolA [Paucibacter sp. B2R-40]|uniref:cell envelope integrity protein TolA n=1 Tax=Paucibacter sp. B2R-40 TaxID=2893554 RepID=UPI0021E36614|nr:cell envelope integrity protein TolA [Paucibacter sp. B2R-40]MCV2355560.1 cell envelope integrity protein TolA [Paucibacter sp. B2R-40]